jgi:hypothetical protein
VSSTSSADETMPAGTSYPPFTVLVGDPDRPVPPALVAELRDAD